MKTTLKDIADYTGYSISTVSRVLNNSSRIGSEAKNQIFNAAKKLNYKAFDQASPDHRKSLKNIALITDFHEGQFYASFFYGFIQSVKNEGPRISLLNVHEPKKSVSPFIKNVIEEGYYDGIILFLPELDNDDYKSILKIIPSNFPIVSNALIDNPSMTTITFDGYSGGFQAANHFESLGLSKLGIVKGPRKKAESRFRYNGFRDYIMQSNQLELVWEDEGDFEYNSGIEAFKKLNASKTDIEGLFVSNDLMAIAVSDAAKLQGYKIPDDIAIVGYDDLPMCFETYPNLSSIKTDFARLGLYSINELQNILTHQTGQHGKLSMLPVSLKARGSSVPDEVKVPV